MRESTLARLVLFVYGLNCMGLAMSVLLKWWIFSAIHFGWIIFTSSYLARHYFDKEDNNASSNTESN